MHTRVLQGGSGHVGIGSVDSGCPERTPIDSAVLGMYYDQTHTTNANDVELEVYGLNQAWDENTVTWDQAQAGVNWKQAGGTLDSEVAQRYRQGDLSSRSLACLHQHHIRATLGTSGKLMFSIGTSKTPQTTLGSPRPTRWRRWIRK